jgi:hypothetical protein
VPGAASASSTGQSASDRVVRTIGIPAEYPVDDVRPGATSR